MPPHLLLRHRDRHPMRQARRTSRNGQFDRMAASLRGMLRCSKPVGHPRANGFGREPAGVHGQLERMFVVITVGANSPQPGNEGFIVPGSCIRFKQFDPS